MSLVGLNIMEVLMPDLSFAQISKTGIVDEHGVDVLGPLAAQALKVFADEFGPDVVARISILLEPVQGMEVHLGGHIASVEEAKATSEECCGTTYVISDDGEPEAVEVVICKLSPTDLCDH